MSNRFRCGDAEVLIGYVYEESSPQDTPIIAAHVATCSACAGEVMALQAAREGLQAWNPPEVPLGFRFDEESARAPAALNSSRWRRPAVPVWFQAAAAVVLFCSGLAFGVWRGGGIAAGVSEASGETPAAVAAAPVVSPVDLQALEERLRAEFLASQSAQQPLEVSRSQGQDSKALLEQVRTLIRESEQRQRRELALRTAEVVRDVDAQRRGDLARIERTFGQMEGTTGVQVEQQRQLLNYLMRVSQRP